MIEKTLKTLTGKIRLKIPTLIDELTLGQLMEMQDKPNLNDLEAVSILSGIPVNELSNVKRAEDFKIFADHVHSLSHQIKYLYNSDQIPEMISFIIGDEQVTVKVIRNLSIEPAGAFMAAREIITEEIQHHIDIYGEDNWQEYFKPSLKACSQLLAQYFYCRATGKSYNEFEAEAFMEHIKKLRVTEALPIAKHFFMNYLSSSTLRTNYWLRLLQSWKKKLELKRSKSLNTLTP